jgi:hypothetical protein
MESLLWGRPPSAVQQAKPASSPRRPWQAAEKLNQAIDFWVAQRFSAAITVLLEWRP